jgi:integrase
VTVPDPKQAVVTDLNATGADIHVSGVEDSGMQDPGMQDCGVVSVRQPAAVTDVGDGEAEGGAGSLGDGSLVDVDGSMSDGSVSDVGLGAAGVSAAGFRRAASSPSTLACYRSDWSRYVAWCDRVGVTALPCAPATAAGYLAAAAVETAVSGRSVPWRYSPATLARWVASINKAHVLAGFVPPGVDPVVKETLAGIRRTRMSGQDRKTPILLSDLETILDALPAEGWPSVVAGLRDRAVLLLGWVGAFRRSEIANLTVGDVQAHPEDGLWVTVRISKTDREAKGHVYALPYASKPILCAPCAWARWRVLLAGWEAADGGPGGRRGLMAATRRIGTDGHVCRQPVSDCLDPSTRAFRAVKVDGSLGDAIGGPAVAGIVKTAAGRVGHDPGRIGGHSLRAGFVTQAFRSGATAHAIMRQTGHRDPRTLEIYARETAPLVGNAVTQVGL